MANGQIPPELMAAMAGGGPPPPPQEEELPPELAGPGIPPPEYLPDDPQTDPMFEIPEGLDLSGVKDGAETEVLCVIEKHGNVAVIKSVDGVPLDKELQGGEGEGSEQQALPPEAGGPPEGPGVPPTGPTGLEGDMMARAMAAGLPMQ